MSGILRSDFCCLTSDVAASARSMVSAAGCVRALVETASTLRRAETMTAWREAVERFRRPPEELSMTIENVEPAGVLEALRVVQDPDLGPRRLDMIFSHSTYALYSLITPRAAEIL